MRDPNRLDAFYDELKELHKRNFPDWRFGQFCVNFLQWLYNERQIDAFFPEDDTMIDYLRVYAAVMQ